MGFSRSMLCRADYCRLVPVALVDRGGGGGWNISRQRVYCKVCARGTTPFWKWGNFCLQWTFWCCLLWAAGFVFVLVISEAGSLLVRIHHHGIHSSHWPCDAMCSFLKRLQRFSGMARRYGGHAESACFEGLDRQESSKVRRQGSGRFRFQALRACTGYRKISKY
jgi:hypothetical protein